jgi:polar amino acid transport system substrate-binding protein
MITAIAPRLYSVITNFYYRHRRLLLIPLTGIIVFLLLISPGVAQQPQQPTAPKPLIVATREIPPFVFADKNEYSGFSIELWRSIAQQLGVQFQFQEYKTVSELLTAVEQKKADLGIAAISITAERQEKFDFSLPMFESGLQILVRNQQNNRNNAVNIFQLFFSPTILQIIGLAVILIIVTAHFLWLAERNHQEEMIPKSYIPGIMKAIWWSASTLATQADEMPKSWPGRTIAVIKMFIGVVFVAYFTANVTTSLTVQQLQGDIQGIDDLPGRQVVTTAGSTAAAFLKEKKVSVSEVPKIEEAYQALHNKKADAVVFDAPVLLYYAANEGKGKVEVVGSVFRKENYGIVLPNSSPYRRQINSALLLLRENGIYQTLYDKWFEVKN